MSSFTEKQLEMLANNVCYIDEFHVEERKGLSLSKYVFEVKPDASYWDSDVNEMLPISPELIGFWVMNWEESLQYLGLDEAVRKRDWVKCTSERKEVVVYEWVPVA